MNNFSSKNTALVIVTIGSFLTLFMVSSINIALPAIQQEFSTNAVLLSWIAPSYLLASAVFLVPFGRLADIYGRKSVFNYGIFIYTVVSLLCTLSSSVLMLIFLPDSAGNRYGDASDRYRHFDLCFSLS